ncbi:hypothetical protein ACFCYC_15615 [Streptomyces sp. NPDC056402]|uniref:hypothetical protein n=1 Tax=Streptomyces sp. NPDC056402 TaxID=3345810 RepID=UPI0035D9E72D
MTRVVCVHGMGQQLQGEERLRSVWWPALSDGLRRAGAEGLVAEADVEVDFYVDLFRAAGQFLAAGDPPYTAGDVEKGFERELLAAWRQAAAETDPEVTSPNAGKECEGVRALVDRLAAGHPQPGRGSPPAGPRPRGQGGAWGVAGPSATSACTD